MKKLVRTGFAMSGGFCYDSASTSPTVAYRAKSLGISCCDGCGMPMVTQPMCELPTLPILFFVQTAKSVVHFPRLWQFAQWLCGHWHIAAVTAQNVKELGAE
jgi:hypothetical protein